VEDAELRALLAAQSRLIAELSERIAPVPASTLTFGALHALYEAAKKRGKSWQTVKYLLRPPIREWRERVAAALRVSDWTALRTSYEEHYAPTTLNQILDWVKALLRWGVEQGLLPDEPHVCRAKWAKCKRARETAPSEGDISAMLGLGSCDAKRRVVVLCDCDAGMRVSEIKQLQWSWLNRERMEIHIPNWAAKGGSGGVTQMTRRLLDAIDNIPRDLRTPFMLTHESKSGPRLYTRQTLSDWWKELAREAGIQAVPGERRVHAHDGRGAFATRAADRGVPIEVIQGMLRHKRLETTIIYLRRRRQRQLSGIAAAREAFELGTEKDRSR
jgi:integrase